MIKSYAKTRIFFILDQFVFVCLFYDVNDAIVAI